MDALTERGQITEVTADERPCVEWVTPAAVAFPVLLWVRTERKLELWGVGGQRRKLLAVT